MRSSRSGNQDTAPKDCLVPQIVAAPARSTVRALFIAVNKLIAPPHMAKQFAAYIAAALREEIDDIGRYYAARGGQLFVAMTTGELAGMFGLERAEPKVVELRRMYVDSEHRRRGIGRDLLARAEQEAWNMCAAQLILSTSELQSAALALYRHTGYREVRQDIATRATNKTLGGSIRRFHFEKAL